MNMIDWKERRKELEDLLGYETPSKFDAIITQEKSIIDEIEEFDCAGCGKFNDVKFLKGKVSKFEADKAELLEALKAIDEAINDNCISDAQMMIKNIIKQVSGEQI